MTGLTHTTLRNRFLRTAVQGLAPALLAVVVAGGAAAQDSGPPALVGRIAAISGAVSMQRADAQDWVDAGVNEPISIGDAVYATEGVDARLQIGATDLDLKSDSEIDIAALDDDAGTIRLDSGSLDLRISELPTADGLSIATPRGTVRLTEPGQYSIDAGSDDQPTRVTAWSGSARLGDSATAVAVQQGQVLLIAGNADAPQYSYDSNVGEPPQAWRTPPRVVQVKETERYVAPEMTGAEDLYQYGAFETAPDYGAVWYPRDVPADWQPYRFGHWEYVAPWGQTWIDDRPWGFAPFHYGRWAHIGSRWGWVPGQYVRRPVYAPALVAFVGGGGFSATIAIGGGGAIGWVPLAPGEGYRPPYRVNNTYIQNINRTTIVNKTVINNYGPGAGPRGFGANAQPQTMAGFANRRFATVVPADAVAGRRPVAQAVVQVRPEQLERAQVNAEAVRAIKPVPAALRPAARPGPIARPPNPRQAVNARPALPPARGGAAGRPNPQQPVPAARPGQPPAPAAQRPQPNQPAATPPAAGRPDNRPAAEARPAPPARPAPVPLRDRPAAPKPDVAKPEAAPKPEMARPQKDRPAITKPQDRPAADNRRPPRPQADAQPQARPPRPQAEPKPQPAPRPETRPAPAPRPQQQQQRPQPQPQQQQQRPQPQAQAPRPQPQAQPPRPQPQAQQQQPRPAPANQKKKPDDQSNK